MDEIWFEKGRWDEGGDSTFIRKRQLEDINNDVQNIVIQDEWILEGVSGLIANKAFSFATTLIWLNLPWEECHKNLRQRGPQFEAFILPHERETSQQNLIKWASTHYSRKDHMSEYFFKEIFKRFPNDKLQLHSRSQIINFISGIEK